MELLQKIIDLPIIAQGTLGSALFWLILELGQRVVRGISRASAKFGKQHKTATQIALASVLAENQEIRRLSFQGMVHGALHYLVKSLILLSMGLSIQSLVPVVGVVGILASIIFLFKALAYVPHFDRWESEEAMRKTYEELKSENKTKNIT